MNGMRVIKRIVAGAVILVVLMMTVAQAEVPFLIHSGSWTLDGVPVEVILKAEVDTHMPFDDERLAMLTPILDMLSLRLITGDDEGSVTIGIADMDALTLNYRGKEVWISSFPDVTYTADEDPMSTLLGASVTITDTYETLGLASEGESLITDGKRMFQQLPTVLEKFGKRSNSATNISGYGKSVYRIDYSFASGKASQLQEGLVTACPDGWLKRILTNLTFTGKQTLRIYFDEQDRPLRVEFNGSCGPEGDIRNVKLVCRVRDDDEVSKVYLELTSPAKKGKNKNDLTFERTIQTNNKGARTVGGSFKYTKTKDSVTSIWNGDFQLINAFSDSADVISGNFTLQKKLNGADKYEAMTIVPDLVIAGSMEKPYINGSITVTEQYAGKVTEQAKVLIDLKPAENVAWEETTKRIDLSAMSEDGLAAERQKVADSIATAIVSPLVIIMGEDAEYFFRDLPPEAVDDIINAASPAAD